MWCILRGVGFGFSQLPLQGQIHGSQEAWGHREDWESGVDKSRCGGGKCPSRASLQQSQPPEHPSPPARYLPVNPPQQRLGDQVQAILPTKPLLQASLPAGKPMKGRTQTEGKDPKLSSPEVCLLSGASLDIPSIPSSAWRPEEAHCPTVSSPGAEFMIS